VVRRIFARNGEPLGTDSVACNGVETAGVLPSRDERQ
jgi:hypothetical protein